MPSKAKRIDRAVNKLPLIPKEVVSHFLTGPMSGEAINAAGAAFKKALTKAALDAELSHHLGYEPGEDQPAGTTNHRNGVTAKTVLTGDGRLPIETPRDRDGSFEPVLIPKHARRFTGFDDTVIALYARGLTVREIQGFLLETDGTEVSANFISTVTDGIQAEVMAWQTRPLETMYPVVFVDALLGQLRPAPASPKDRHHDHKRQPAQAVGPDEVPARRAHRVAVKPACLDLRAPAAFDCVVDAEHHLADRQKGVEHLHQERARHGGTIPARPNSAPRGSTRSPGSPPDLRIPVDRDH